MTKEAIIQKLAITLAKLPEEKILEVADFASYLIKKQDDHDVLNGIAYLVENSKSFEFINDDDNIYTFEDIIDPY